MSTLERRLARLEAATRPPRCWTIAEGDPVPADHRERDTLVIIRRFSACGGDTATGEYEGARPTHRPT